MGLYYYGRLNLRQLYNAITQSNHMTDNKFRQEWEQVRLLGSILINTAQIDKAGKRKLFKMLDFPWDKQQSLERDKKEELKSKSDKLHGRTF